MSVVSAARVLIVDDSPLFVSALRHVFEGDPRFVVVGHASDGREAIGLVNELEPDVVTMDLHMPRLSGIEAIDEIMASRPVPILVMTADPRAEESGLCFDALSRGALDLMPKPRLDDERARTALKDRVHLLSTVPVVPHRRRRPASTEGTRRLAPGESPTVLGIVASTGGPSALARIVSGLPADLPFGVVIVQHLFRGFAGHLVSWLGATSRLPVELAREGALVEPGTIWLAPDEHHVRVTARRRLALHDGPPVDGHCPSGDVLLRSLAEELGPAAMGLVLTGMGRDGAQGIRALLDAGGITFAQDSASAAVDGMPKAAREAGAQHVVSLDEVVPALLSVTRRGERSQRP